MYLQHNHDIFNSSKTPHAVMLMMQHTVKKVAFLIICMGKWTPFSASVTLSQPYLQKITFDLDTALLTQIQMIPQKQWTPVDSDHVGRLLPINLSLLIKVIVLIDPIPYHAPSDTGAHVENPSGDSRPHLLPRTWSSHQILLISPTFSTWSLSGTSLVLSLCSAFPSESSSFIMISLSDSALLILLGVTLWPLISIC